MDNSGAYDRTSGKKRRDVSAITKEGYAQGHLFHGFPDDEIIATHRRAFESNGAHGRHIRIDMTDTESGTMITLFVAVPKKGSRSRTWHTTSRSIHSNLYDVLSNLSEML